MRVQFISDSFEQTFIEGVNFMLAIDHIVIASKNPEKDAKEFEERYGVKCIPGGKHTNWGTFNYLAYFDNNCYIEWLGIFDEQLAEKSDNPLIQQLVSLFQAGESGAYTFALRTKNMEHELKHFKQNSIACKGPLPGARKKVDGSTLSWRMLFPEHTNLPFLIEWGEGINLPDDRSKINEQQLASIQLPYDKELYTETFALSGEANKIPLENGKLIFSTDSGIDFTICEIDK